MTTDLDDYRLNIPSTTLRALGLYLLQGIRTGSFLEAVLSNDLTGAVLYGDEESLRALPLIVRLLHNRFPFEAWGSPGKFEHWIAAPPEARAVYLKYVSFRTVELLTD